MKPSLLVLLACGLPLVSRSQEDRPITEIHFPKSDVRDVLSYYQRLTAKSVLVPLSDFQALVTIESTEPLSREAATNLIRKTLLESYGIELRTSDRGETLVTWSLDPKYPRRSDAPMTKTERDALPKTVIRVIRPTRDK
ncbi:hypothetical protein ACXR0O_15460 [Verrucomicrobiota bacterium sgz303538]